MGRKNFFDEKVDTLEQVNHIQLSRKDKTKDWFTILAVFLIGFLILTICFDTYSSIQTLVQEEKEKSKVCLKEFTTQQCNPYSASEKCEQLVTCIR